MKKVVRVRRTLHRIPELAFHEYETRKFIKEYVKHNASNFKLIDESQGGLVFLKSGHGGSVLWRSEMDALPIEETEKKSYMSHNKGISHSCGHDAHMAILLETMCDVNTYCNKDVYCIFQSAEEAFGGASKMVNRLEELGIKVDEAYSLHVDPGQASGIILSKPGIALAANDTFRINIDLKGGHVSGRNTYLQVINTVMNFIKRYERKNLKISISSIQDDGYLNINPSRLTFVLSFRNLSRKENNLKDLLTNLKSIETVTKIIVQKLPHYPMVENDLKLVNDLIEICSDKEINFQQAYQSFSSDDFSYYSKVSRKKLYFYLGCSFHGELKQCHTSTFDLNEDCLDTGKVICKYILGCEKGEENGRKTSKQ